MDADFPLKEGWNLLLLSYGMVTILGSAIWWCPRPRPLRLLPIVKIVARIP